MTPTVSVVFGTLNRLPFLQRAVESARIAVGNYPYEIVIVDGGSVDGTLPYLKSQSDVTLIEQGARLGAVAAFNAGFEKARGEFVASFNDDAEYIGQPIAYAIELLNQNEAIGQVALMFSTQILHDADGLKTINTKNQNPRVQMVRTALYGEMPYANFGVIRKRLGQQVEWWGSYYQYGGDTELSVKVRAAGFEIAVLAKQYGYIVHYELQDSTRIPNVEQLAFNAKWRQRQHVQQPAREQRRQEYAKSLPPPVNESAPKLAPEIALASPNPIRITSRFNEPQRVSMSYPTRVEYLGGKHGKMNFHRDGSRFTYVIGAQAPVFWADGNDVEWLVKARDHGRAMFRVIENNG